MHSFIAAILLLNCHTSHTLVESLCHTGEISETWSTDNAQRTVEKLSVERWTLFPFGGLGLHYVAEEAMLLKDNVVYI